MKFDLEKMRKKNKWSGKEVGLALMANTLNDIKYNGEEHEPLFPQEFFTKMEKSINTEKEEQIYKVYCCLYSVILDAYNTGQELYQQFYYGYSRLENMLDELIKVEKTRALLSKSPLYVKEVEYYKLTHMAHNALRIQKDSDMSIKNTDKTIIDLVLNKIKEYSVHQDISFSNVIIADIIDDTALLDDDGNIYYQDPLQYFTSIYTLSKNNNTKDIIYSLQYELVYHALAYLYSFNALLLLIEDVYEIENLSTIATLSTKALEEEINQYNAKLVVLQENICGTTAQQDEKRSILDSLLTPLLIEDLRPSQDNVKTVHQQLANFDFTSSAVNELKKFDTFMTILSKGPTI